MLDSPENKPACQEDTTDQVDESLLRQIATGWNKRANDDLAIPMRYRKKSLEMLQDRSEEIKHALQAIEDGRGVFLFGGTGTGKTHLAIGLLLHWLAWKVVAPKLRRRSGLFVSTPELLLELKSAFGQKAAEETLIQRYSGVDMLLLDDIGAEKLSDWSRSVLFLLLDRRYRGCRQAIVTSNLSLDAIASQIDDRISSRLVEMCTVIKLAGADRRLMPAPRTASVETEGSRLIQ